MPPGFSAVASRFGRYFSSRPSSFFMLTSASASIFIDWILAAERNRTAGEEARVLAGKLRHGLQWRARRLARRLQHLGR